MVEVVKAVTGRRRGREAEYAWRWGEKGPVFPVFNLCMTGKQQRGRTVSNRFRPRCRSDLRGERRRPELVFGLVRGRGGEKRRGEKRLRGPLFWKRDMNEPPLKGPLGCREVEKRIAIDRLRRCSRGDRNSRRQPRAGKITRQHTNSSRGVFDSLLVKKEGGKWSLISPVGTPLILGRGKRGTNSPLTLPYFLGAVLIGSFRADE